LVATLGVAMHPAETARAASDYRGDARNVCSQLERWWRAGWLR